MYRIALLYMFMVLRMMFGQNVGVSGDNALFH